MPTSSSNAQRQAMVSKWKRRHRKPEPPPSKQCPGHRSKSQAVLPASGSSSKPSTSHRHPLQSSEAAGAARDRRRIVIILTSSFFLTAAAAIALRLQLFWFMSHGNGKHKARDRNVEALLQMLWTNSNTSLDPCQDFYWYACYNFERSRSTSFFRFIYAPALTIQGLSQNEAGRAIFAYFSSCISAQWLPDNNVRNAVDALLEMLNVDVAATSLGMFISIMKLNLLYGLHTDPIVYLNAHGAFPKEIDRELLPVPRKRRTRRLYVIAVPDNFCGLSLSSPALTVLYESTLNVTATAIKVNVTLRQLLQLTTQLCNVSDNGTYTVAETNVFGSFIPEVSAWLWESVVRDLTRTKPRTFWFIHSSRRALEHRFRVLMNRSLQPLPVVLLVTKAAVGLVLESTASGEWGNRYHDFCLYLTGQLTPLWMLNHMLTFSATTLHNDVITAVFNALVDTIEDEIGAIPCIPDKAEAWQMLHELELVLPYHVYPIDMPIPKFRASIFHNLLRVRQYGLVYDRYEAPEEIPDNLIAQVEDFYPAHIDHFISVPMAMYTSLALESKSSVEAVAVFGVMIADAIWSAVDVANLKKNSTAHSRCKGQPDISFEDDDEQIMKWPRRALASAIGALRVPDWYKENLQLGYWRTSRSQIFYHLVAVTFYCAENPGVAAFTRGQLLRFLSQSADFFKTFGCSANALNGSCKETQFDM